MAQGTCETLHKILGERELELRASWSFGELEAALAHVHEIDESKRTAFQARLKNFHRLRYPMGFSAIKGRAATYSPLQIADMALALEMTQLGLPPDRATSVLCSNRWPTLMALKMAARALAESPQEFDPHGERPDDPLSMFLFFDPSALHALTLHMPPEFLPDFDQASNTFFYGGIGVVQENLVKWTSGSLCRLSLINVTALLHLIAHSPFDQGSAHNIAYRQSFLRQLCDDADTDMIAWEGGDEAEEAQAWGIMEREVIGTSADLAERMNIPFPRAERYFRESLYERARQANDRD